LISSLKTIFITYFHTVQGSFARLLFPYPQKGFEGYEFLGFVIITEKQGSVK